MKGTIALVLLLSVVGFAANPERCVVSIGVPTYPPLAEQARIEGTVRVVITVDEAGSVVKATAVSGHQMLQGATIENVKTWRFSPAPKANPSVFIISYEYRIEGQEIEMSERRCPTVKLDLPTRVEVTSPPLIVHADSVE